MLSREIHILPSVPFRHFNIYSYCFSHGDMMISAETTRSAMVELCYDATADARARRAHTPAHRSDAARLGRMRSRYRPAIVFSMKATFSFSPPRLRRFRRIDMRRRGGADYFSQEPRESTYYRASAS